jgi:hypothetical protein
MFKSKTRSIIIPQSEHGRLAGMLALLWGNADFDRPALDFAAFVDGVILHDWNYGLIDTLPIMEAGEEEWLAMARRGVEHTFENPITDIVVKLHLKRLLKSHDYPERQKLVRVIDGQVAARLPQTGFTLADFEWADKITRFCDMVAFDFSFEQPTTATIDLYARCDVDQMIPVTYEIKPDSKIHVDPWPFSVPCYSDFIFGYQRAGYPDNLCPVIIKFQLFPKDKS